MVRASSRIASVERTGIPVVVFDGRERDMLPDAAIAHVVRTSVAVVLARLHLERVAPFRHRAAALATGPEADAKRVRDGLLYAQRPITGERARILATDTACGGPPTYPACAPITSCHSTRTACEYRRAFIASLDSCYRNDYHPEQLIPHGPLYTSSRPLIVTKLQLPHNAMQSERAEEAQDHKHDHNADDPRQGQPFPVPHRRPAMRARGRVISHSPTACFTRLQCHRAGTDTPSGRGAQASSHLRPSFLNTPATAQEITGS